MLFLLPVPLLLLKKKKEKKENLLVLEATAPSIKRFRMRGSSRATTCVRSTPSRLASLSRFLERIVNIITVRRTDNLDRCKTTDRPLLPDARRLYIYMHIHIHACIMHRLVHALERSANETFRFTKSSGTREPREWGRKSRGRMLISHPRGSYLRAAARKYCCARSTRGCRSFQPGMAVKRHLRGN